MTARIVLEIFILFLLLYSIIRFVREGRGGGILKGLAFLIAAGIVLLFVLVKQLELPVLDKLFEEFLPISLTALLIIFQPELRMGLIRLGQNPLVGTFLKSDDRVIEEVVKAVTRMAKDRVGALIAIQREIELGAYAEGRAQIDAEVSAELLETIFWPGSSLHDGGVVIRKDRIASAGCLFPLSDNPELSTRLGTRHRAAVGISEQSDALVVVVSEERGEISVAIGGTLNQNVSSEVLEEILEEHLRRSHAGGGGAKAS
jgi:diadenylate cyclase